MKKNKNKSGTENCTLIEKITKIKKENPFWGYRRVWSCLVKNHGIKVEVNTVYRLMKELALLCPRKSCLELLFSGKEKLQFFVTISSDFKKAS